MNTSLPENWPLVKLGACLKRRKDTVMPATLDDASVGLVGLEDIQDGGRGGITIRPTKPSDIDSLKTRFQAGDILYGKLRPYLNKVGIVAKEGLCSTEIWAFTTQPFLHPQFAAFFLASTFFVDRVASMTKGANLPRLDTEAFDSVDIPLPPLSEQQQIVNILQEAEEIRRLRAQAEAKTTELIPATFFNFFGDVEHQFGNRPMRELVADFRYGTSQSSGDSGTTTLRIPNILSDRISFEDLVNVDERDNSLEKLLLQTGDMLFVRTNGNPDFVGRCGVFDLEDAKRELGDGVPVIFASYLIRARLKPNLMRPWFLHAFLRSPLGRARVLKQARTAAGQYNINTEGLGAIRVPVPPLELQDNFLLGSIEIQKITEMVRLSEKQVTSLGVSLSAHAFSGQLTADWREANQKKLTAEVRRRDESLNKPNRESLSVSVHSPKLYSSTIESARVIPTALSQAQQTVLAALEDDYRQKRVGESSWFTAEKLARSGRLEADVDAHALTSHLAMLAARGFVVAASREQSDPRTGERAFGTLYRLVAAVRENDDAGTDEGEPLPGVLVRTTELEALGAQLKNLGGGA